MQKDLKFSEIKKKSVEWLEKATGSNYFIKILTNITVSPAKDYLEAQLRHNKIKAHVEIGNFDNIIQDSRTLHQENVILVFWDISTILKKLDTLSDFDNVAGALVKDLSFLVNELRNVPLVMFNNFTSLFYSEDSRFNEFAIKLSQKLNKELFLLVKEMKNVKIVDIDLLLKSGGIEKFIDKRFFEVSSAPYSISFYKEYCQLIQDNIITNIENPKKVLVMDCDNTLWGGIVGEDGMNGIKMGAKSELGDCFRQIQKLVLSLVGNGVILCLASKNNLEDVDEVIQNHPEMLIKDEHIVLKKVNWKNKFENVREIAEELNLGLNSFVFVDDSPFEVNQMRQMNSEVTSLIVPKITKSYPVFFNQLSSFFWKKEMTREDRIKTNMYKDELKRKEVQSFIGNSDEYLKSLSLQMRININPKEQVNRIFQLLHKTNQFNLTSRRPKREELVSFFELEEKLVFTTEINDKYGSYGITGVILAKSINDNVYEVDSFLMSCRVLGRGCEFVFFNNFIYSLIERGAIRVVARFVRTKRNMQVKDFYKKLKFEVTSDNEFETCYSLDLEKFVPVENNYIEVLK